VVRISGVEIGSVSTYLSELVLGYESVDSRVVRV
jgi:hypothetical protein